jgi:phosphoribosyl 1,2-cyclic phosphodiesterase
MELKVLGSSSSGNCYLFDNGRETLVIEAGVPFAEVKKAVDFDISRIAGCLISHEHGDHAGHVNEFLASMIPVWVSGGTFQNLKFKSDRKPAIAHSKQEFQTGGFRILPFDVQHDCAEPFGFLIRHDECGTVLFCTDTYYLKYRFPGLNNIMIECNYSEDILFENVEKGRVSDTVAQRAFKSHMSYDNCVKTLLANDLSTVNNIVLIHLSDSNSNAREFKEGIQEATGKNVHVAEKGMILNFNKTPF